eukprot:364785-Chlamydomonas_euryale.AAC.10
MSRACVRCAMCACGVIAGHLGAAPGVEGHRGNRAPGSQHKLKGYMYFALMKSKVGDAERVSPCCASGAVPDPAPRAFSLASPPPETHSLSARHIMCTSRAFASASKQNTRAFPPQPPPPPSSCTHHIMCTSRACHNLLLPPPPALHYIMCASRACHNLLLPPPPAPHHIICTSRACHNLLLPPPPAPHHIMCVLGLRMHAQTEHTRLPAATSRASACMRKLNTRACPPQRPPQPSSTRPGRAPCTPRLACTPVDRLRHKPAACCAVACR